MYGERKKEQLMSAEEPEIQAIFNEAIALGSNEDRVRYLDRVCVDNHRVRARVEALLNAHSEAGGFFGGKSPATHATEIHTPTETPGTVIGRYKLVEQIGEGGMGTVWMAQQSHPVRRLVAVKLIKLGLDSRQVIARFEAERQALALMDHPNIAKVLDAGTAGDSGRPYVVMELVKGVPITRYCDEHHLTPRQRLELFMPVCQAIQHAHQKGIIHRDIKPSNVLVAMFDDKPVPKIIDFGVAKATGQQLTELTLNTSFGAVVGTLEYMSPEQAGFNQLDIDTRSDIYSLGVLLYELLSGSPPFQRKELEQAGILEMLRVIREQEPSKPSTKLSSSDSLPSLSANRGTEPSRLTRLLRGELDWIVMKALEKERTRRYETANAFAMDVQRYLSDETVQACPPSAGYRFRKFARRNRRVLVTTGVLAFVILVAVGAVAASIGWAWSDRASRQAAVEKEAELALGEAERWAEQEKWPEALDAAKRGGGFLAGGNSRVSGRIHDLRKDLEMLIRLDEVRLQVAELQGGWHEWDAVHEGYAKAFADYGIDVLNLSTEEAADRLRARDRLAIPLAVTLDLWSCTYSPKTRSVATRIRAVAARVDTDPWRRRVREALDRTDGPTLVELVGSPELVGQPRNSLNVLEQGLKSSGHPREALEVLLRTQQLYPADFWANYWLAHELYWLRRPNYDDVLTFARTAVGIRPKCAAAYLLLALALQRKVKYGEALVYHDRAIELAPNNPFAHHDRGWTLNLMGKQDEAIVCYRRAIELWPENPHAYGMLGNTLTALKKPDEGIEAFRMSAKFNPNAAHAHNQLGAALRNHNRFDDAMDAYNRTIKLKPDDEGGWSGRAFVHFRQQQWDRAVADFSQAVKLDPEVHTNWWHRGHAHLQLQQWDEAARDFGTVVEKWPHESEGWYRRGAARAQLKQLDRALADLRQAVENGFENLEMMKSDPLLAPLRTRVEFGKLLEWLEWKVAARQDEASPHVGFVPPELRKLDETIASYREALRLEPGRVETHTNLGRSLARRGQHEQAIKSYRNAVTLDPKNAAAHYYLAWELTVCPDRQFRDPNLALVSAQQAVQLDPSNRMYQQGLGYAEYRSGNWKAAVTAFEKVKELGSPGDSMEWFPLAMARWQLGDKDAAQKTYEQASEWMNTRKPQNEFLRGLQVEAAELMGIALENK
jgi:tetratricopeptide (TPR) repeat protein